VGTANEVFNSWKENPHYTEEDIRELGKRKSLAINKLNALSSAANAAKKHWVSFGLKVQQIDEKCKEKCWGDLNNDGTCGAAASCLLDKTNPLMHNVTEGMRLLDVMSVKRLIAFRECDFLMVNAPKRETAQIMCQHKLDAFAHIKEVVNTIAKHSRLISDARADAYKARDTLLGSAQNILEALLAIITALIEVIRAGFDVLIKTLPAIAKGVTKLSGFLVEHPNAILVIGGVVGLGVLAFIARPYVSILAAGIGR